MKILIIPDLHGHDSWKLLCKNSKNYDKIVFLGDYLDSFTVSNEKIIENFLEVIEFKKNNYDKTILLLGNHDTQYIPKFSFHKVSGFRKSCEKQLNEIFNKDMQYLKLFKMAYSYDNFLFTHAGINSHWAIRHNIKFDSALSMSNNINDIWFSSNYYPIFDCGIFRNGRQVTGGPIWNDIREIEKSQIIDKIIQIAGHTPLEKVFVIEKNEDSKMIFCDSLPNEYVTIIDGTIQINKF